MNKEGADHDPEYVGRRRPTAGGPKKQKSRELRREAEALPKDRAGVFRKALSRPGLNFICEVKKASPSKGLIAPDFPAIAKPPAPPSPY